MVDLYDLYNNNGIKIYIFVLCKKLWIYNNFKLCDERNNEKYGISMQTFENNLYEFKEEINTIY